MASPAYAPDADPTKIQVPMTPTAPVLGAVQAGSPTMTAQAAPAIPGAPAVAAPPTPAAPSFAPDSAPSIPIPGQAPITAPPIAAAPNFASPQAAADTTPTIPVAAPAVAPPVSPPASPVGNGGAPPVAGPVPTPAVTLAPVDQTVLPGASPSTTQQLAALAGNQTTNPGAPPVATADNWQGQDQALADYAKRNESYHAAQGLQDMQQGYNPFETQEQLNARRGLVQSANGTWIDPAQQPAVATDPTTTYNYNGLSNTPSSQSINGGPLTDAKGAPLAPGTNQFGEVAQSNNTFGQPLLGPSGAPIADQIGGSQGPEVATQSTSESSGTGAPSVAGAPAYGNLVSSDSPEGNYLGQTIQPGAGVDRVRLAQDAFDTFQKSSDPAYQAAVREAISNGAALGQIGSGGLRTSVGNLANARQNTLENERATLTNNALTGSIDDAYKNIGIAQQQQGFQANQQQTAFGQGTQQEYLDEALRNGDYNRARGILDAGESGNPSTTAQNLSNNYGNQSSAAAAGAGQLIANAIANNSSSAALDQIKRLLPNGGVGLTPQQITQAISNIPGLQSIDLSSLVNAGGNSTTSQAPAIDTGYSGSVYQPSYPGT